MALCAALLLSIFLAGTAQAHHSWAGYETSRTFYLAGTVREASWSNPHAEIVLEVPADTAAPEGLSRAGISEKLEKVGGRQSLARASAPKNAKGTWTVELESPSYMAVRGMDGPPRVGDRVEAVGFLVGSEPKHLRVEAVFLEDGRTISVREAAVPTLPSGEAALGSNEEQAAAKAGPGDKSAAAGGGANRGGTGGDAPEAEADPTSIAADDAGDGGWRVA